MDPKTTAQRYLDAWNETDGRARLALLDRAFAPDVTYVDPLARTHGTAELGALIGGVQERFPGFRFAQKGEADGHGEHVRFSWTLGPDGIEPPIEGTDVVVIAEGRIRAVTGFLDKVPPHAA